MADEVKRRNYFREILARSDITGLCETNASSDPAKNFSAFAAAAASDPQLACDVWWTQGLAASTGMALVIKRSLRATDVQKIYDDGTGHTLVVDLTVHDKLPLRVVLSHAPPQSGRHGNALRQRYFERLAAEPLLAAPRGRVVIWGGDFNMVELPEYDGGRYTDAGHREMVQALRAAMTHMGCTVDAYRAQHPHLDVHRDARHITRGRRRIDRFYIGDSYIDGVPGVICCEHIDQVEFQVRGRCRKALSPPDHKAVRLVLRLSTELAAPPPWRCKLAAFTPEQQAEAIAEVKEHLAKAAEGLVSYGEAQASWQEGLRASLEKKHKQNSQDRHRRRGAHRRPPQARHAAGLGRGRGGQGGAPRRRRRLRGGRFGRAVGQDGSRDADPGARRRGGSDDGAGAARGRDGNG